MNQLKSANIFDELPDSALIQIRQLTNFEVTPYSTTTIWRKSRSGEFPTPIKVSNGITAFRVGEIRQWLADPKGYKAMSAVKNTNKSGGK